jgi:hypothetical protein
VGHEFLGLDGGGLVRDDARDVDLAFREFDLLPDLVV